MQLSFTKMQAAGNDYIFLDCLLKEVENPTLLAKKLCNRRFSVGADGLVLVLSSQIADAKIRIINSDGSEAQMCGNAIRCAAKLLYESNYAKKSHITIETISGVRDIYLTIKNGIIEKITVDMGKATVGELFLFETAGEKFEMRNINVGNDHQVTFVPDVDYLNLSLIGHNFECNSRFPLGINTEFCEIIGANHLKVRTFERGVGETLACGTGACASALAAIKNGICFSSKPIKISMRGGELSVICDEEMQLKLIGTAEKVYDGYIRL